MSEGQRVSRAKTKPDRSGASGATERPGAAPARAPAPSAEWAAAQLGSAFPLGVQRKVQIGPSGDAYEHQADRVSADVASGRSNLRVVDRVGEPVGASRVAEIGLDLYVHLELLWLVALGVADAVAPAKGHAAQLDAIHVPNCLEID